MPKHRLNSPSDWVDDNSLPAEISMAKKPKKEATGRTQRTQWTPEEDEILILTIEQVIKQHIWEKVKADGRLVKRTSYGCQYHARMLLRQGTGKTTPTASETNMQSENE